MGIWYELKKFRVQKFSGPRGWWWGEEANNGIKQME
jgi:hypothetical protein